MKLTKRQWRMLMTEILEARNEASAAHAFIENQLEDLRQRLRAIERQLEPTELIEPVVVEGCPRCGCPIEVAEPLPKGTRLHTYVLQEDGTTRECEP